MATRHTENVPHQRIAVIGSGISGLLTAWLLAQRHQVVLFEKADYLGGHTHTVDVTLDGTVHPVDSGFLVFNDLTYPGLVSLFRHLDVPVADSDMSFSVRIESEDLEWAGSSVASLFADPRNLGRRDFWRMLKDVIRFNKEVSGMIRAGTTIRDTVGGFLERHQYSPAFRDWYLLPMGGAIWSCPTKRMLDYPAQAFFRFFYNHGLLQISDRPQWKTVRGGAREYVNRLARGIQEVRLNAAVTAVRRSAQSATVFTEAGGPEEFHQVILACHSDQALALLQNASQQERAVLGAIRYQPNLAVLHVDRNFLPRSRRAWSAWNYRADRGAKGEQPVSVTYLLNQLQPVPFRTPLMVTLNPPAMPAEATLIDSFAYDHPVFDAGAVAAQALLPSIQAVNRTWFCGAWAGHGFHEDGVNSALAVAQSFGVAAPWSQSVVVA